MKRRAIALMSVLFLSQAALGEDSGVLLEINVFQGFRARITEPPAPGAVVYLPEDPGWSDNVERQRLQIAQNLGLEGVSVLLLKRVAAPYGATQRITATASPYGMTQDPTTKELPLTIAVRPTRSGDRGVLLDLQILLGKKQEIAAASVSGELGKTFVLGGKPGGNPIFIAITPRAIGETSGAVETFTVGDEIKGPKVVTRVEPSYPEELRRQKKAGIVVIQAIVNTDGSVGSAAVVRHSDPGFDETALTAVRQWRYEPATLHGKPVRVYLPIFVNFRMD
jgi:TonB family protein